MRFSSLSAPFPLHHCPFYAPLTLRLRSIIFCALPLPLRSGSPKFRLAPLRFPLRSHALSLNRPIFPGNWTTYFCHTAWVTKTQPQKLALQPTDRANSWNQWKFTMSRMPWNPRFSAEAVNPVFFAKCRAALPWVPWYFSNDSSSASFH